jgi:hypothetical protein
MARTIRDIGKLACFEGRIGYGNPQVKRKNDELSRSNIKRSGIDL